MKYLFLYTVSPVQSFIAEARKAQDLFIGSQLLSDMMQAAINFAKDNSNGTTDFELVFPHPKVSNKPNRFIVLVDPKGSIKDFGDALKKYTEGLLLELAEKHLLPVVGNQPGIKAEVIRQLQHFLEIYWVAIPYQATTYAQDFARLEQYLGGIKTNRTFTQLEEKGRKCSVNGNYNVKFYRRTERETKSNRPLKRKLFQDSTSVKVYNFEEHPSVKLALGTKNITEKQIQAGEGLSAISFLKRLYKVQETEKFPSTAEVALYDTRNKVRQQEIIQWANYKSLFEGRLKPFFDYQFFFEENIVKDRLPAKALKKIQLAQIRMADAVREQDLKFNRYYALVHFDGDKMGKILSGALLKFPEQTDLRKFQNTLSELLGDFASWASETVVLSPRGRTVYAGGDDFLGFINLNHLFDVLIELRTGFDQRVNQVLQVEKGFQLTQPFTFSAGIAIAHYKEPLSIVVQSANDAEEVAKNAGNRNAFCIKASKHSGDAHQSFFKWSYFKDSTSQQVLLVAKELWQNLSEGKISNTFIHKLAMTFSPILEVDGTLLAPFNMAVKTELLRLMERSRIKEKGSKEEQKKRKEAIQQLGESLFDVFLGSEQRFDNFLEFLFTIDFIQRNTNPLKTK